MDKENFKTLYQKVNNFKRDADIETLCVIRNEVVNPLISFVVPTCGRVDTLRDTLNSIIAQDNNGIDYEIIVMDNSCDFTDSNPVYVFLQELNSNRIAYFQNKKNLGFDGNSNRGVLMSRGEWISFVHDDDMITPDYFVQIKKYIERYKDVSYIKTNVIEFDDIYNSLSKNEMYRISSWAEKKIWHKLKKIRKIDALILGYSLTCIPSCGTLVKKRDFIEVGGFNRELYPSSDAYPGYLMLDKHNVYKTNEPLGYYRWSVNASLKKETILGFIEANQYFREYVYTENIFSKLYGFLLGDAYFSKNVDEWISRAMQYDVEITADDIAGIKEYKPCKIRKKIIVLLQKYYLKFDKLGQLVGGKGV